MTISPGYVPAGSGDSRYAVTVPLVGLANATSSRRIWSSPVVFVRSRLTGWVASYSKRPRAASYRLCITAGSVATIDSGAAEGAGVGEGDALTDAFAEALAAGGGAP